MAHVSVFIFKKYIYFAAATLTRQKEEKNRLLSPVMVTFSHDCVVQYGG